MFTFAAEIYLLILQQSPTANCWTDILDRGLLLSSCSVCTFCPTQAQIYCAVLVLDNCACVGQKVQTEQLERSSPLTRMCVQDCQWNTTVVTCVIYHNIKVEAC